jgi:hypothetical protein
MNVQVSDIPYAEKFGGNHPVDMKLAEYVEEVKQHRIIGGQHPWYVFKGHPIPRLSEGKDSLVRQEICPLPEKIKETFILASPVRAPLSCLVLSCNLLNCLVFWFLSPPNPTPYPNPTL